MSELSGRGNVRMRAVELGAERIVDLATLTGAMIVSLGNEYGGLFSNNDTLAGESGSDRLHGEAVQTPCPRSTRLKSRRVH